MRNVAIRGEKTKPVAALRCLAGDFGILKVGRVDGAAQADDDRFR
jgi:hypothetical protein